MKLEDLCGRINPDMSFESVARQRTEDDVRRERLVSIMVLVAIILVVVGAPFFTNLGKILFAIEPIIY